MVLSDKGFNEMDLNMSEIPYKKNVKFLNTERFAQFVGYGLDTQILEQYQHAITLSLNAMFDDFSLDELSEMVVESKNNLIKIADNIRSKLNLNYNTLLQEGFEYHLKNGTGIDLSYLLYKDTEDIGLLKFL